jgi:hypothetical protein
MRRTIYMIVTVIAALFLFKAAYGQTENLDLLQLNPKISEVAPSATAFFQQDPREIVIKAVDGQPVVDVKLSFDLESGKLLPFRFVYTEVFNHSKDEVLVIVRLGGDKWVVGGEVIPPNSKGLVQTPIYRDVLPKQIDSAFFGMYGLPGGILKLGGKFDPANINSVNLVLPVAKKGQEISVTKIFASELIDFGLSREKSFFPFIDEFGQYKHGEYFGKIKSKEDMLLHGNQEYSDMKKHPVPIDWDQYGGWKEGPSLEATQHFRTVKYNEKWWLVTPDGNLFWSHGVNCVRTESNTPITDREHYFEYLPAKNLLNGKLYTHRKNAPKGYYIGKNFDLVDFYKLNLFRKYGENYVEKFTDGIQKRFGSWGLNTIGNWSEKDVYLAGKIPYTVQINTESVPIAGTSGQWRKFPDPFHPLFEQNLIKSMEEQVLQKTVDDPMCIGYFVDNELSWGGKTYLAEGMLLSGNDQPAKLYWMNYLKSKYNTLKAINQVWGTKFKNWKELELITAKTQRMEGDLEAFNELIAEKYFSTVNGVLKKYAPNKLYLGCRFDFHFYPTEERHGAWVIEVAAKHSDIISFNRYRYSAEDLYYHSQNIDKPIIIGEIHFCSLDRGLLHSGLRGAKDQDHRKRLYEYYYTSALRNPLIVGVHWFQYADQMASGRFDGENYQAGFVNIVDVPHPETVEAARNIGRNMYIIRTSKIDD